VVPININANFNQRYIDILEEIGRISGDAKIKTTIVQSYNPDPPHGAQSVVTNEEANPLLPGPQDHNVWG
jgi:hypothetical protein